MADVHRFHARIVWTGNTGQGTANYRAYKRDHEISGEGKPVTIPGSSDPAFRGDPARYSPEELLVASLSTCHMLWMLHLCADAGISIVDYADEAWGEMVLSPDGSGHFSSVTLQPKIKITDSQRVADALGLNERAHVMCFIANSVNFPVRCLPHVEAD